MKSVSKLGLVILESAAFLVVWALFGNIGDAVLGLSFVIGFALLLWFLFDRPDPTKLRLSLAESLAGVFPLAVMLEVVDRFSLDLSMALPLIIIGVILGGKCRDWAKFAQEAFEVEY